MACDSSIKESTIVNGIAFGEIKKKKKKRKEEERDALNFHEDKLV